MRLIQHIGWQFVGAITGAAALTAGLVLLPVATVHAQGYSYPQYIEPPYSSAVVGFAHVSFEDYSSNPNDLIFRVEQRVAASFYLSAQYYDFSEPQTDFELPSAIEDMQLGFGYLERSELGPHADLSLLIGRETFQRPVHAEPFTALLDKSNYAGVQFALREVHGALEAQAGIAYLYHDGARDNQVRWHVSAYYTLWQNLAVGLRYQDNDDYRVGSVELRYTW